MLYREEKRQEGFTRPMKALIALGGVVIGFVICRIFLLPVTVPDSSMEPGLMKGDTVVTLRHVSPAKGEIAVFDSPPRPDRVMVRRVVAAEGDTVEIRDKVLYINNAKARFRWNIRSRDGRIFPMKFSQRDTMPPVRLGRHQYFVLSDTLDMAYDSRTFGVIGRDAIRGRMLFKY